MTTITEKQVKLVKYLISTTPYDVAEIEDMVGVKVEDWDFRDLEALKEAVDVPAEQMDDTLSVFVSTMKARKPTGSQSQKKEDTGKVEKKEEKQDEKNNDSEGDEQTPPPEQTAHSDNKALAKRINETHPSKIIKNMTEEQVSLIKEFCAKDATDDEFLFFLNLARKKNLDPLQRQIHFVSRRRWDKRTNQWVRTFSVQVGVDGFLVIAARTKELDGIKTECIYVEDGKKKKLVGGRAEVWRKGWRRSVVEEVSFAEYVQTNKEGLPTSFWADKPETMIKKVALSHALRQAFPDELSGLYTDEEMQQADNTTPYQRAEVGDAGDEQ